ncbi:MAG: hypothetical protein AB7S77_19995, partial [Desulfatirhabdiaceae bacterium]
MIGPSDLRQRHIVNPPIAATLELSRTDYLPACPAIGCRCFPAVPFMTIRIWESYFENGVLLDESFRYMDKT